MAEQKVNININTKGAKKSKEELSSLNSSIDKMGKVVAKASAVYFGAKGLINAVSTVTNAYAIQEKAEKALEVALGRTSKSLLDQASALQQMTTAGDEAIIEQQAFLASLKFTEDQIKTIIPVALDLSAATGISLESAVRNTSKTFSGLAGELGELVPQLRDLTQEEMKAGDAVKVLADLFKGQASKQADTYAGSVQQLKNELGDMAEDMGRIVVPVFEKLAPHLRLAIDFYSEFLKVGEDTKESQANITPEIERLSVEIEKQASLIDYISGESYRLFDMMKIRATESGKTFVEQMNFENEEILRQTELLENLETKLETAKQKQEDLAEAKRLEIELNSQISDIRRSEVDMAIETVEVNKIAKSSFLDLLKAKVASVEISKEDLKLAALQQSSAKDAMKAVVRAETMEAVAGYIASVLKTVPFPANLVLAAGGGALVSGLIDKGLSSFATGGDFITSGPQMIMVGDNPGGRERVQVSPLSSPNINGPGGGGVTVNIQGGIVDESYVSNELIPAINKATSLGTKLNA